MTELQFLHLKAVHCIHGESLALLNNVPTAKFFGQQCNTSTQSHDGLSQQEAFRLVPRGDAHACTAEHRRTEQEQQAQLKRSTACIKQIQTGGQVMNACTRENCLHDCTIISREIRHHLCPFWMPLMPTQWFLRQA